MKKIQEVIQDKHDNLSQILDCLTKALLQYTNLDPEISERKQLLVIYFQNFTDMRAELKCLEEEPPTLQAEVLVVAFKVWHGRDEKPPKQDYLKITKAF